MLVAQSFPTLYDPMDCGPPGSSVHGILQARILEWVAICFLSPFFLGGGFYHFPFDLQEFFYVKDPLPNKSA